MKITILTLFPEMFSGPFSSSIIKNAQAKGLVELEFINIRDFGIGTHKTVDDTPYGGGTGMIMRVDVIKAAIDAAKNQSGLDLQKQKVILMSASGKKYDQRLAESYSTLSHLIIICGHYEGFDDRVRNYIDEEISIGDFVLTGGEIPAMLIIDSVTRLLKGVLKEGVTDSESFSYKDGENENYLLEYPAFTRPQTFEESSVPEVLTTGNHKKIDQWRLEQAKNKTEEKRPDLLKSTT